MLLLSCIFCAKLPRTVIVPPEIVEIIFVETVPFGIITWSLLVAVPVVGKSVIAVSSTVIWFVPLTPIILPARLTPALTGSAISIICPGLHNAAASKAVVNATVSVSFASEYKNQRPSLLAW